MTRVRFNGVERVPRENQMSTRVVILWDVLNDDGDPIFTGTRAEIRRYLVIRARKVAADRSKWGRRDSAS